MANREHQALPTGSQLHSASEAYTLQQYLGSGGFGITYKATTTEGTTVAVKEYIPQDATRNGTVLIPSSAQHPDWDEEKRKAILEAERVGKLKRSNPQINIAAVIETLEQNNTVYIVLEFIDGENLEDVLRKSGQLPEGEVYRLITEVGTALSVAHNVNIIHRDIKPANIMLDKAGHAVLIDFGAAREFVLGEELSQTAIGSHRYYPPEQTSRRGVRGPYTDVYALAVTFYVLLTGNHPNPDDDKTIRPGLLAALRKGMAYDAKDRQQDVAMFLHEVNIGRQADLPGAEAIALVNDASKNRPRTVNTTLNSIHMYSYDNGWAVGEGGTIFHYNGSEWLPVYGYTNAPLYSIQMVSDDELWIVGGRTILGYIKGTWLTVPDLPAITLNSVSMISASEGWAVGGAFVIVHFSKTGEVSQWQIIGTEGVETLKKVQMFSATEGWAVGTQHLSSSGSNPVVLLRYNGRNWRDAAILAETTIHSDYLALPISSPVRSEIVEVSRIDVKGFFMSSPTEGWITGYGWHVRADGMGSSGLGGLVLRYKEGQLAVANVPTYTTYNAVYMVSANEGWFVGSGFAVHYTRDEDGIEHWEPVPLPSNIMLNAIHMLSHDEGWAVGCRYLTLNSYTSAIMHYKDGRWAEYKW